MTRARSQESSTRRGQTAAPTRASVDAFHDAALGHGGRDNGKPGLRAGYGESYYAAFIVDPDGYRIEAYCDRAG